MKAIKVAITQNSYQQSKAKNKREIKQKKKISYVNNSLCLQLSRKRMLGFKSPVP